MQPLLTVTLSLTRVDAAANTLLEAEPVREGRDEGRRDPVDPVELNLEIRM